MKVYKYLFNWIFTIASKNENDYSPSYTAMFATSQLVAFNLLSLINFNLKQISEILIPLTIISVVKIYFLISFLVLFLNYAFFIHRKKYQKIENINLTYSMLIIIYIIVTFYYLLLSFTEIKVLQ